MKDKELLEIARTVRHKAQIHKDSNYDLGCWCAICSFHIFKKIKNKGEKVYFAVVSQESKGAHCFVLYKNKMIDVTATQFNEIEAVIIADFSDIQNSKRWFWDKNHMNKLASVKSIEKELKEWPEEQNPFKVDFSC